MTRVVGAAVLALAGLGAVAAFPSATFADGVCGGGAFSSSSGTASCTYSPGSYNFTVPGGVTQERVQVAGGQGGQAGPAQPGGLGGYASAITSVTPGYALVISVGCRGGDGDGSVQGGGGAGAGGCGGGGNGGNGGGQQSSGQSGFAGGGGGGRSVVDFYAGGEGHLYAAGGGGGGGNGGDNYCYEFFGITCRSFPGGPGGYGGGAAGGSNGADGATRALLIGGGGGAGATAAADGGGGAGWAYLSGGPSGSSGANGLGGAARDGGYGFSFPVGNGNTFGGGGGGGGGAGYHGGGGGGAGTGTGGGGVTDSGGGGGGGGGSTFISGAAADTVVAGSAHSGDGSVTVTWTLQPTNFAAYASPSSTTYPNTVQLLASSLPSDATGSVTFTFGSTLCTATVSAGSASCTTGVLAPRLYDAVTATYSGDAGYLGSSAFTLFTIVTVPPTISASATTVDSKPYVSGAWTNQGVTVHFTCADTNGPGLAGSCPSDQAFATEGQFTSAAATVADTAGNVSSAANTFAVNVDLTPPTISASATTADSEPYISGTWTNQVVTVHFTCADTGGSGLAGSCPSDQTFSTQGQSTSAAATVADTAGNLSAAANTFAVNVDLTAPTISAGATTTDSKPYVPGAWTNQAVTVHFTCADTGGSGLAGPCPADQPYAAEGAAQSASGSVSDVAGNSASTSFTNINIDQAAPKTIAAISSGTLGANGWYKAGSPVQLSMSASDNLSGVAVTTYSVNGGGAQTYSGSPVTFPDGTYKVTFGSTDQAGNVETNPANVITFKVDQTAPKTSASLSGTKGGNNWYVGPITLTLTGSDPAAAADGTSSGVATTQYSTDNGATWQSYGGAIIFPKDGKYSVSFKSTDAAGNAETPPAPITFQIDQTAPVTTAATSGTPGANGWYKAGTAVKLTLTAQDPTAADGSSSGLASTGYSVNGGPSQNYGGPVTLTDGVYSVTYQSTDNAGNAEKAEGASTIKVDQTVPSVVITGVSNGSTYTLGGATPRYTATDAGSGIDTSSATLAKPATASGVGTYTYIATAADKAGNSTTVSATYKVVYNGSGSFLAPVSGNSYSANSNQTIPVKFDLLDANGNFVSTAVATLAVNGKPAGTFGVNGNHYQLNIKLRDLGITSGTADAVVTLDDGTTKTLVITVS